jgi:hypothetical protein
MAAVLMIVVVALIGLGIVSIFAGYKAMKQPSNNRILVSSAYAVAGAILLFAAYAIFFYTLRVVLGAE